MAVHRERERENQGNQVKQYPGYNFVGLVFGPGGDNQKRLEKETGAMIQVYGIKVEGGLKVEIKPSNGNEFHGSYEDLYVHISADAFEKVDAAVSVIELLITSVSGNLAAASATSNSASGDFVQDVAISDLGHNSAMQSLPGPPVTRPQGQFQYPGQWFPPGPPNTALQPPSGFIPPPNSFALPLNNPTHMSTPPFRPSNMSSLFGPPPLPVVGFNALPQRPQPQAQLSQHPYMAQTTRNPSPIAPQLPSAQANNVSSTVIQLLPTGITGPSMPLVPQPVSSLPPGSLLVNTPVSASFSMTQIAPRLFPTNGLCPGVLPSNTSTAVPVSPMNPPPASPVFPSVLQPQMGLPPSLSASISPTAVSAPALGSGSVANFSAVKPPLLTAPSTGNFTFQPHRPQNPASHAAPWTSNQFGTWNTPPANSFQQPPASQQPLSLFLRPQVSNNVGQPQPHTSVVPFARKEAGIQGPVLPTFLNASGVAPRNQILQVGPRSFSPIPQMPTLPGALPSGPGNSHVPLQNYPVQRMRSETLLAQNHQVNNNLSFASGRSASTPGEQQLYDPFSPTSMPHQQQQGGIPRR